MRHYPFSLLCTVLIWVLCFRQTDDLPSISLPSMDKLVHFGMYFGTCATVWWEDLKRHGRERQGFLLLYALVLPVLMGGLIEVLQAQTSYRGGDWADLVADALGALAAWPLGHYVLLPVFRNE